MPSGVARLDDLPYPVFDAIHAALTFLSFEELPNEDRPSRDIWLDHELMSEHWDLVKERRERMYQGGDYDQEIEDPVENEYAAGLRDRLKHGG